ncbi:hypothetical protein B566_EDAN007159 [Ephemera danica]|nr:hypothetical protein B566_EDAN007159 [Ephemera danica]
MDVSQRWSLVIFALILQAQNTWTENMMFHEHCPQESNNVNAWYPGTGDCNESQWLVLGSEVDSLPRCKQMPCGKDTEMKVKDTTGQVGCYARRSTVPCPAGMEVVFQDTGEGDCDCTSEHAFYSRRDRTTRRMVEECYPLFQQGPCGPRQIFHLRPTENRAQCRPNPCPDGEVNVQVRSNGEVRLPPGQTRVRCVRLQQPCDGSAPVDNILQLNGTTNRLECVPGSLRIRQLIDAPLLNCPPGSRRDAAGRCRRSI